jgi:hypothetical protein
MASKFIEAKDREELRKKLNSENSELGYAVIKKVAGGYMCFEYQTDYDIWNNQK